MTRKQEIYQDMLWWTLAVSSERRVLAMYAALDASRLEKSIDEHAGIAQALIEEDGELAAARVVAHLGAGKQRLLNPKRL